MAAPLFASALPSVSGFCACAARSGRIPPPISPPPLPSLFFFFPLSRPVYANKLIPFRKRWDKPLRSPPLDGGRRKEPPQLRNRQTPRRRRRRCFPRRQAGRPPLPLRASPFLPSSLTGPPHRRGATAVSFRRGARGGGLFFLGLLGAYEKRRRPRAPLLGVLAGGRGPAR